MVQGGMLVPSGDIIYDFVQDASKVQNTRLAALFCESHG